jgi:DNA-3-methyladenine glycosylase II
MTPEYWSEAKRHLAKRDAVLRRLVKSYPDPALASRGDAFQALARSIVGQQISVKAADSIWKRFAERAGNVKAASVATIAPEDLRACGFSGQKASYMLDLATRFASGEIQPRRWSRLDDEAIVEDLTRVKGIGRWTVEMFLIFHMKRPDVFPVGDLGLLRAMERQYNDGEPLTKDEMREIGKPWQPYRTAATWYLWRSLENVPA